MNKVRSSEERWGLALVLLLAGVGCAAPDELDDEADPVAFEGAVEALTVGAPGGGVHGRMRASYDALGKNTVLLPDVSVYLREAVNGANGAAVRTDLQGFYALPAQKQGFYRLCWEKPGFTAACGTQLISLGAGTVFPGVTPVAAVATPALRIWGKVELADRSKCFHQDEFFGIEHTATATLLAANGAVLQRTRANHEGDFVLTQVVADGSVRVQCGELTQTFALRGSHVDLKGGKPWKLTLPNRRPQIRAIAALVGAAKGVSVTPGTTVRLEASSVDPDGHGLSHRWKVQRGVGTLTVTANPAVAEWKVPAFEGTHSAYLTVSDGRGGYALREVQVRVHAPANSNVVFSGVVQTQQGAPVERARVSIGGTSVLSGARGTFTLQVREAGAYVLNIEKRGFAESSQRALSPARGLVYTLTEAFAQTIDPSKVNVVRDQRERWRYAQRGNQTGRQKPYLRRGGVVTIPADALVDEAGKLARPDAGPYTAYIATIDPTSERMLGDMSARRRDGRATALFSYGALFFEVRDRAGREYNLAPGKLAEMELPIQDPIRSGESTPARIPMWTFDLRSGSWSELPDAGDLKGDHYATRVSSFSTKNADAEKTNPSCIRLQLAPELPADGTYVARVDVVVSPGSVRRFEVTLDDANNVIYNLPDNAAFVTELFDGPPTTGVLKDTIPGNTGAPWGGVGVPPYPYAACATQYVELADVTLGVPFLTFKGAGDAATAAAYYQSIDPNNDVVPNERATLGGFWSKNGFDPSTGAGGVRASFINHNDLGFGRDMHCRTSGANLACWVTNYGGPDQAPGNFALAQVANPAMAIATVTMEYSPLDSGGAPLVKFYVYAGGSAGGVRLDSADLDRAGPKFIPNLCLNCHGGSAGTTPSFGSSFREFDVYSYRDGSGANPSVADGIADVLAQQPSFRQLNDMVRATSPAPAIGELITAFYSGGAGFVVDPLAVPAAWKASATGDVSTEAFYRDVVGASCRTCHVALDASIDWGSYAEFRGFRTTAHAYTCNLKLMPHANITFKNFWLGSGPARLGSYTGPGWAALGACSP
ncbi:MAG: hypothetical protein ABW252_04245 [Polyangiales bacterium]